MTDPGSPEARHSDAAERRLLHVVPPAADDQGEDDGWTEFLAAADAKSTLVAYATRWADFDSWCNENGLQSFPADPVVVCRYLDAAARQTEDPLTAATIAGRLAAIGRRHADAGFPDPTKDPRVTGVLRGIRRTRTRTGETPNRAPAATLDDVRAMVSEAHSSARTWRAQIMARRDIAVLLLAWSTANRRSELAALHGSDLAMVDGKLQIRLRGSKTSHSAVELQYVARGDTDPLFCPWCATIRWLIVIEAHDSATGEDEAAIAVQRALRRDAKHDPHVHRCGTLPALRHAGLPVFRSLSRSDGGLPTSREPITGRSIARIIAGRAKKAGVRSLRGHSLRAGRTTAMFDDKVPLEDVMAVTRHRRAETALIYDRRRAERSGDVSHGL